MTRTMRLAGLHVALVAMVLRALLPAGWMPSHSAGAPLMICTAEGHVAVGAPSKPGHPADPADHDHQLCPFAAAVHLAVAANAFHLPVPLEFGRSFEPAYVPTRHTAEFTSYSSRGPPSFV